MRNRFSSIVKFVGLLLATVTVIVACNTPPQISQDTPTSQETVKVSLFSWPGYGFWFIAKEKNLVPELDLDISIIEDPYESFSLMSAGQLDVTSSTVEYGPIAADSGVPVKLVAYTNPSFGTDKIILGPDIQSPQDLKGKQVAVLEGGLSQIYMGIWLEENGLTIEDVEFVNLIMDDAVAAMLSGEVAAGEFWEPFGSQVLDGLEGANVVATSSEDYWIKTALLADGMYMSQDFIDKRPDAAKLAMKAYFAAVDFWKNNPEEGNQIIADGLQFGLGDVELVIGNDGKPKDGGLYIFDLEESSRFMGVTDGKPPLEWENKQIEKHWELTSDWWMKFGLITQKQEPESGISYEPMTSLVNE
ncbi:MAG: ABC transporter substrate-binding protein [Leptolyngbya sp. SIO3F4]|nr:ABC transporter substrate-binding protein [Leptolyngbya sp. SIO3F4]